MLMAVAECQSTYSKCVDSRSSFGAFTLVQIAGKQYLRALSLTVTHSNISLFYFLQGFALPLKAAFLSGLQNCYSA